MSTLGFSDHNHKSDQLEQRKLKSLRKFINFRKNEYCEYLKLSLKENGFELEKHYSEITIPSYSAFSLHDKWDSGLLRWSISIFLGIFLAVITIQSQLII